MISLQADSLYITTQQIFHRVGSFHWALLLTDSANNAQRYEWMQLQRNSINNGAAEGFVHRSYNTDQIPDSVDNQCVLAILRVEGFKGLPKNYDPDKNWTDIFTSSNTILQNRKRGVTCRTWLLKVIDMLENEGCFVQGKLERALEQVVTDKSIISEARLADGTFNGALVEDI